MNKQKVARMVLLVVLVAFLLSVMVGPAYAAKADSDTAKAGDKKISAKKGLEALEQDPKEEEAEGATGVQKMIGFGSIVVMIIVVRYL